MPRPKRPFGGKASDMFGKATTVKFDLSQAKGFDVPAGSNYLVSWKESEEYTESDLSKFKWKRSTRRMHFDCRDIFHEGPNSLTFLHTDGRLYRLTKKFLAYCMV